MKKLTLKDLQSLAHELPVVSEKEQRVYVGDGTGSNLNPFSEEEYRSMLGDGTWEGGFVMTDESGSTGMSMQYIPSSTSAEEDLLPESAENHDLYSMFDNHQLMTMDLNDGDSENCSTMPSGYWDGSGFWTGSGYLDGSGYWDGSGYVTASGYWDGSGWTDKVSGDWAFERDLSEVDVLPEKGGTSEVVVRPGSGGGSFGGGFQDIGGLFDGGGHNGSGNTGSGNNVGGGTSGGSGASLVGGGSSSNGIITGGHGVGHGGGNDSKTDEERFKDNVVKGEEWKSLTQAQKDIFKKLDIQINEDLKNPQYDSKKNIMYIYDANMNVNSLKHEMLHAYQDQILDALDGATSHSNGEFQAFLMDSIRGNINMNKITNEGLSAFYDWHGKYVELGDTTITVDKNAFKSAEFDKMYAGFRDRHKELAEKATDKSLKAAYEKYAQAPDPNYKWEWEKVLDFSGVQVK